MMKPKGFRFGRIQRIRSGLARRSLQKKPLPHRSEAAAGSMHEQGNQDDDRDRHTEKEQQ